MYEEHGLQLSMLRNVPASTCGDWVFPIWICMRSPVKASCLGRHCLGKDLEGSPYLLQVINLSSFFYLLVVLSFVLTKGWACLSQLSLIQIMRVLSPWPNHLPQAPTPSTPTLGISVSTYKFRGGIHFQLIARMDRFLLTQKGTNAETKLQAKACSDTRRLLRCILTLPEKDTYMLRSCVKPAAPGGMSVRPETAYQRVLPLQCTTCHQGWGGIGLKNKPQNQDLEDPKEPVMA